MSFLDQIAVLVLTRNEEANIARTLGALADFDEVLVLDSESDDRTAAIVRAAPNARLVTRRFDVHAKQWNHGLSLLPSARPWVLALDADYVLTREAVEEMSRLDPLPETAGYRARVTYCVGGHPLRGSLYPPTTVLFRRNAGQFVQSGHTQRLRIEGKVLPLTQPLLHDDRKPLSRWFEAQARYARLEAKHLLAVRPDQLRRIDRIRRLGWLAPLLVVPHTLVAKRCLFDGWRGWHYALQRLIAEAGIALALLDQRLAGPNGGEGGGAEAENDADPRT